ncbi:MAG: hypothetical protein HKN04_03015 [Rhodothermaceae bacterium]|nr:hypothetical protein [Rhodothermaceae bacterium]
MADNAANGGGRRWSPWSIAAWAAAALVLLIPLIAMQFTDEVTWSVADFVIAGILLLAVGIPLELVVRKTGNAAYRWAVGLALATAFLLVWLNGAVGILGAENNDANMLYGGVLAIGVVGALVARFRPPGMARALAATALAQAALALGALVAGWGSPESGPFEVVALNGFFVALWTGSAVLFGAAARKQPPTDAGLVS